MRNSCLRAIDGSKNILKWAKEVCHAVIMGGGPVSLHAAEALLKHDPVITMVIASDHVLSTVMSGEGAMRIQDEMRRPEG